MSGAAIFELLKFAGSGLDSTAAPALLAAEG